MEVKRGYKLTVVGVIPEPWEIRPCSAICGLITVGIVIRPAQYYVKQGVPALRSANIREDGIDDTEMVFISETANSLLSKSQVRAGDVLTVRTGYPGTSAVVPPSFAGSNCIDILITRPTKAVNAHFLALWINSSFGKYQILRNQGGLAQQHFNVADLRNLIVALPPLPEQEAIAEALSDADALIDSLERLLAKKRDLKQGAMQELLTGKRRLLGLDTRNGYKQTEIGLIPEDWEVKLLPDVCRFRSGKAHEQHISPFGRFVCVNSKFISSDGAVRKYSSINSCCAKKGDILMVMSDLPNGRALAKAYLADEDDLYAVNQRVCALTPYRDSSKFLFYVLSRNPYFLKFDDGVNQTHLLNPVFKKFPLALPATKDEQIAIADILCDMDVEIDALEEKLTKARQVKQGMMQELLTGRIRLCQPDHSHEVAA